MISSLLGMIVFSIYVKISSEKLLEKKVGTKYTCPSKNKYCLFTTELRIPNSNTRSSIFTVKEALALAKIEFLLIFTISNELKSFK